MRVNPGVRSAPGEKTAAAFGVEIDGGSMVGMIERGAPLPVRARRLFTTVSDRQAAVEINVLRTDAAGTSRAGPAAPPESVGRFLLSGIRVGRPGEPRIEVSLEIDGDGIVRAAARDLDTGALQEVAFSQGPPFDRASPAMEVTETLRRRVMSLVQRVREESVALSRQEHPTLRSEIDEMVARSISSLSSQGSEDLLGYRSALETLLGEIHALRVTRPFAPRGKAGGLG